MEIKIDRYLLVLSAEVLNILHRSMQRKQSDPESGGIILGKVTAENILVQRLSIPTELDRRSRTNFERHRLSAQIIINYEYANSYGQVTYLGEWHTHPEDHPSPSGTDIKMIRQQFTQNKIYTDFLILLIQGNKSLFAAIINQDGAIKASHNLTNNS